MQRQTIARLAAYLTLTACFLALLFFGLRTFLLQLETGDSFPEYSTYRADPKGLKVFYDSLKATEVLGVARQLQSSKILPSGESRALVVAGVSADQRVISDEESQLFEHWLATGGRLIIAFRPERNKETGPSSGEPGKPDMVETTAISWRSLIRRWGAGIVPSKGFNSYSVESQKFGQIFRWFGSQCFDRLEPEWKPIATQGKCDVIIERPIARGSLVLLADSYPLSNEALARDRNSAFLLWLVRDCRAVLFEETHLGLSERPGIVTLALRYGLQGTILSLVTVMLLFVWKSQYSLVPGTSPDRSRISVQGYSSEQAFLNLLRREIPSRELLDICIKTWVKTAPVTSAQKALLEKFGSEPNADKSIVERYNRLVLVLVSAPS